VGVGGYYYCFWRCRNCYFNFRRCQLWIRFLIDNRLSHIQCRINVFEPIKCQPIHFFYLCPPLKRRIGCSRRVESVRFKERDIHSHICVPSNWVVASVPFLVCRVYGTRIKFRALILVEVNKRNTTKDVW
jgi:hypothetical protein